MLKMYWNLFKKSAKLYNIFIFDLLKLFKSELCQFGIVAQMSDMAHFGHARQSSEIQDQCG